jgi:hypothetical protein
MIGFPFDSLVTYDEFGNPIFDRAVSSKPLKSLIGKLFTTGVMPNPSDNFQVFAGTEGMTVIVHAGFAVIEGGLKLEEDSRTLEVQASDSNYDRIDTVVLRWNGNDNARVCDLYVLEGTPAPEPVRPELTRAGSIYEIGLADIIIPRNTGTISQQRITDTRYDTDRCGIVSSVSEFDTTTLYEQVQADLADFKDVEEAEFLEWFDTIKEKLENLTPEDLGFGGGVSQDSGLARTVAITDYDLVKNGIVAVTFTVDVPANATLNVNAQGAKPIYYRGSAIVANVIRGGDTVTFMYDGTNYKVLCIDGGAGHEIENSAGTKLTQRDVMQVLDGLEAVDDSTNQKTKIKMNLPIVSSADWNAMTEQEKTAYKASHYRFGVEVPDTEGVINAEYMKLLWENPNTTQAFAPQTITLNSADYDFLLWITSEGSTICRKGQVMRISEAATSDSSYTINRMRTANYASDTTYNVQDCKQQNANGTRSSVNTLFIPIAIYGIKKNFQFKVNAIATDLSTRADHCFLSDDETSVEEALDNRTVIINCTSPVNTSTLREIDYPDGFNQNNTMILGTQVLHVSNGYWYAPLNFMIYTTPTKIVISSANSTTSSFDNRPMRIAVCKATPIS